MINSPYNNKFEKDSSKLKKYTGSNLTKIMFPGVSDANLFFICTYHKNSIFKCLKVTHTFLKRNALPVAPVNFY